MINQPDIFLRNLKFAYAGLLITAVFTLLAVILLNTDLGTVQAAEETRPRTKTRQKYDGPNVITAGMSNMAHNAEQALYSVEHTISTTAQTAAAAASAGAKTAYTGTKTGLAVAGSSVASGATIAGQTIGSSASFVANAHIQTFGAITEALSIQTFLRPAEQAEVPIIDPNSPELHAALAALPAKEETSQNPAQPSPGPAWPMHGYVTADFGVNHRPYQRTHTGIDIADGRGSDVTPIKPFRPGLVIDTVHMRSGLGNHVIVDHGNGVTSVYAHLAFISVQKGQQVNLDTALGRAGSTGLSTGPHLHFEIRVHGQAANPRQFIPGNP